jgi:threonine dehydrogenase-like Zn-dependent dehydrogenase
MVELQDVDEPTPADGEVVVQVTASGICGSELHGVRHPGFRVPPLVMGHEFTGRTADGRDVVVNPIVSCGDCDLCLRGLDNLCRTRAIVGIHRAGGFGERVSLPVGQLHDVPAGISMTDAALIEPLANAVHAFGQVASMEPTRVAVIGAGTIGLVSLLVAKHAGVDDVAVVDLSPKRRDFAEQLGGKVGDRLSGEFDVVIDAVGAGATHRDSVERLRPGGAAVWLGLLEEDAGFDSKGLVRNEQRVLGSFAYTRGEFADAVAMAPSMDLSWATTFPLEQGQDIFSELMNGSTDVAKALLCSEVAAG